jgi:hypothetical protein
MISLPSAVRAFFCTRSVDMRKSFDGLSGLVEECFRQDLLDGHLFLFVNRRRDRIKALYFDHDGLAIWYKKQVRDCPHPLAFTGIDGYPHNRAGWPDAAGGMDRSSPPSDPRRCPMSRDAGLVTPPRARPSFGRRRSANSGAA